MKQKRYKVPASKPKLRAPHKPTKGHEDRSKRHSRQAKHKKPVDVSHD